VTEQDPAARHQTRRRAIELAVVIALAVALMTFEPLHDLTQRLLDGITKIIAAHPVTGKVVFFIASALSAMLAFFSSAIIVPAAVYAWGPRVTLLLLWTAWLAGGCGTYAVGRTLGRRIAAWLVSPERVAYYAARISRKTSFATVLLFQTALPSEVPGYVLGTIKYSFARYVVALAIAELPYAIGAVYLGDSFVHRNYVLLLAIGVAGLLATAVALRFLRRRVSHTTGDVEDHSRAVHSSYALQPPATDPDAGGTS
jgi:uncharacterized membrane protein YdjX (TVP38/TMEM64 family)